MAKAISEFQVYASEQAVEVVHTEGHRYKFEQTSGTSKLGTVEITPNHASGIFVSSLEEDARKAALAALDRAQPGGAEENVHAREKGAMRMANEAGAHRLGSHRVSRCVGWMRAREVIKNSQNDRLRQRVHQVLRNPLGDGYEENRAGAFSDRVGGSCLCRAEQT
jgi:hypothetical protein